MRPDVSTTFQAYVYDDANYEKTLELVDNTSHNALTSSIFSADRKAFLTATDTELCNAASDVYYNEKCTGAIVG
ncbi:uncharacterized protein HD556DRAFT_1439572 [Suillus plorans]|uniref:Uncharacterized protein n=1 Tax=Suillus plorans TaxID=116603 RepID=A0A9P7DPN6_9AGAM|nr:uncharacterized protein HD556DRAFT_1439572 [Suillus plorans]KAG1799904.1 hypothetical protein HD556DRAFT_1439572 [Suillus plorans]